MSYKTGTEEPPLDESLLERLLAPHDLLDRLSPRLDIAGATLLSATPREVDAPGYLSDLVGVTLEWNGHAGLPRTAVLKVSHAGFGREELPFYETIADRLECPVTARFYAGGTDGPTGRTWLLLEDLSDSHERPSEAPLPPTFERSATIVEGLARLHAAGRGKDIAAPTLQERLRSIPLEAHAARLFDQAGDALDDRTRGLYAEWLPRFPELAERAGRIRGNTLLHGDAHVWNWMLPRAGAGGAARLIDWDGWLLGPGVWDLAYMMAVQWDREVRQRFEAKLLDRYHHALQAAGVRDYPRDALQEDYRLAVLLHLRTPVARFARKMSAYVWWPQLMRVGRAAQDLDCLALLR